MFQFALREQQFEWWVLPFGTLVAACALVTCRSGWSQTESTNVATLSVPVEGVIERSVAISGDLCVVAATQDSEACGAYGRVAVFSCGSGSWVEESVLLSSTSPGGLFGAAIALDGGLLAVSAPGEDEFSGAVYVYKQQGNQWVSDGKLIADDRAEYDHFGAAVGCFGSTIVIGAWGDDDQGSLAGAAYVFRRNEESNTWIQEAKLIAPEDEPGAALGWAVAVTADMCIVGAPQAAHGGAVRVFQCNASNVWTLTATLSPGVPGDRFGSALAIAGSKAVVGAPFSSTEYKNTGAAYVFQCDNEGQWTESLIVPTDAAAGDRFGWSVSATPTRVSIARATTGSNGDHVLIYHSVGGAWVCSQTLSAHEVGAKSVSISMAGTRLAVTSAAEAGCAQVFDLTTSSSQ